MPSGVCRLIDNHPILVFVESAPEVRVLPSDGIARPRWYHDPGRLPPEAAAICELRANPDTSVVFVHVRRYKATKSALSKGVATSLFSVRARGTEEAPGNSHVSRERTRRSWPTSCYHLKIVRGDDCRILNCPTTTSTQPIRMAAISTTTGKAPNPSYSVRPDGAEHQWRKVPPGELSVSSGS